MAAAKYFALADSVERKLAQPSDAQDKQYWYLQCLCCGKPKNRPRLGESKHHCDDCSLAMARYVLNRDNPRNERMAVLDKIRAMQRPT